MSKKCDNLLGPNGEQLCIKCKVIMKLRVTRDGKWVWSCPNLPRGCIHNRPYTGPMDKNNNPAYMTAIDKVENELLSTAYNTVKTNKRGTPYIENLFDHYGQDLNWFEEIESY